MYRDQSTSHAKGFTLVELMIVLVIASILLAIAAPGLRSLLERNRLQATASNVYASLVLARSEALKRNQRVIICKSTTGTGCQTSTAGAWEGGWLVHKDPNNPGTLDPNDVLLVREGLDAGDLLRVVDDPAAATPTDINLLSYGRNGGANIQAAFVICNADADAANGRTIAVSLTGRPNFSNTVTDCFE